MNLIIRSACFLFFYFLLQNLSGQKTSDVAARKEYLPEKITKAPVIDGVLNDECWINSAVATDFIQYQPEFGKNAVYNSAIKLVYDDNAIYVAARLFDPEPSKINKTLTPRDVTAFGIADFFLLTPSCRHARPTPSRSHEAPPVADRGGAERGGPCGLRFCTRRSRGGFGLRPRGH